MNPPTRAWPNGTVAGILLALFLMVPLFVAIFMDVDSGRNQPTAVSQSVFPGPGH